MIKIGQVWEMSGDSWSPSNKGRLIIIIDVDYSHASFRFLGDNGHKRSDGWDLGRFIDIFTLVVDV